MHLFVVQPNKPEVTRFNASSYLLSSMFIQNSQLITSSTCMHHFI